MAKVNSETTPKPPGLPKARRYRALTGISYPTDPKVIKRILSGELVPFEERGVKEVAAGQVVDDIPAVSVPWLLDQNLIEEVAG